MELSAASILRMSRLRYNALFDRWVRKWTRSTSSLVLTKLDMYNISCSLTYLRLSHLLQHRLRKIVGGTISTHVPGPGFAGPVSILIQIVADQRIGDLPFSNYIIDSFGNPIGMFVETQMSE